MFTAFFLSTILATFPNMGANCVEFNTATNSVQYTVNGHMRRAYYEDMGDGLTYNHSVPYRVKAVEAILDDMPVKPGERTTLICNSQSGDWR